ncbi:hypothetical protein RhiirA4_546627 [Rhizophagus irregularis]|uniref:Uncharacterized protein n=1 Tax=Rhizophagus irregularis TaxID=588596 RepID=A0A2I1GYC3_9GLOM|nr:hypothetical protein RhiirA4_546627 [Rhizophagus irregularis]
MTDIIIPLIQTTLRGISYKQAFISTKQPNNHDDKGVSSQEFEAKEVVKNITSITKHPSHKLKAKQPNNHDNEGVSTIATTGQKHKTKESIKDFPLATRHSAQKCKAKEDVETTPLISAIQPPDDEKGVEDVEVVRIPLANVLVANVKQYNII